MYGVWTTVAWASCHCTLESDSSGPVERQSPAFMQVVLEVLERNVRQGSEVYEVGHAVVLVWCASEQELSQLQRILAQLCEARRVGCGTDVVVVLSQQREKLELESIFAEALPAVSWHGWGQRFGNYCTIGSTHGHTLIQMQEARHGTRLVFRQGSPLDPAALHAVAVTSARTVIISGDYNRPPVESDAQVLRSAVLLDELSTEEYGSRQWQDGAGPVIIAQMKLDDGPQVVRYACSDRVVAVPTTLINVRRFRCGKQRYSHGCWMLQSAPCTRHSMVHPFPSTLLLQPSATPPHLCCV